MRPIFALLLAAAATCFFAAKAGINSSPSQEKLSPSIRNIATPSKKDGTLITPQEKLGNLPNEANHILSELPFNTTLLRSIRPPATPYNAAYLRRNPKVLVRIYYSIDSHGALFINYGTRSVRSRAEVIRTMQHTKHYTHVKKWQGWLHVGSVIGFRAVNTAGPGGLIFAMQIKVGRKWVKHNTGKYPLPLHTFSPRSRYTGWLKIGYRPCRWQKALGRYVHNLRLAPRFPYSTGAKYTWPWRRHAGKSVYHVGHVIYRYKLGGECGYRPPGIPLPKPVAHRKLRLVTINFSSDNTGYLYINGRVVRVNRKPLGATYYRAWLPVGTVIGFQATNTGGPGGIIASILIQHGRRRYRLNTGRYPFRVHGISRNKRFNHIWKFPTYNTCRWTRASKTFVHNLKISRRFPYKIGAKYIWFPKAHKRRGTLFMRYKIGGERCHPRRRRHYRLVTIYFAADNVGYLYINGKKRRVVKSWKTSSRWTGWVRLGWTIGIEAKNVKGPGGIIASVIVRHGRRTYRLNTGRYPFRVHLYWKNPRHRRLNHIWKFPAYKTCAWPRATGNYVHKLRISRSFPYKTGAKYVWAPGNSNFVGTLFLRLRLGGERCKGPPHPPPGRGCPCRKSTNPNRGGCFRFIGKEPTGSAPGFCRKKDCEIKYECTSRALAKGRCIWRFATDEIKVVSSGGRLTCRRVRLPKRERFLVPYSG